MYYVVQDSTNYSFILFFSIKNYAPPNLGLTSFTFWVFRVTIRDHNYYFNNYLKDINPYIFLLVSEAFLLQAPCSCRFHNCNKNKKLRYFDLVLEVLLSPSVLHSGRLVLSTTTLHQKFIITLTRGGLGA